MRIYKASGATSALRLMLVTASLCALMLISGTVSARQYKIIERVSVSTTGVETKNASRPVISGSGTYVAFWTDIGALVPDDTNFAGDVFIRNRSNGVTERVSLGVGGIQTARTDTNPPATYPDIGIDDSGTFVTFASDATNIIDLHLSDTNNVTDVFVVDRSLPASNPTRTRKISFGSVAGQPQGNGGSFNPTISGNGQFIVYRSVANSIVNGDGNSQPDIFIYDRIVNSNARVNLSTAGAEANNEDGNSDFSVSDDGRYVAFESLATNLIASDTNAKRDIFIRDRSGGGSTCRLSLAPGGLQTNGDSIEPFISGTGNTVVFTSFASNLVAGDTNGQADIFIWERAAPTDCTGTISRVSVSSDGLESSGGSARPSTNDSGRYVLYWSVGANLVDGDTNGQPDFFLFDRTTEITTRVNVNASYEQSNGFQNQFASINDDGFVIAYESFGSNLIGTDTNASSDVFVAQGGPSSPHDLTLTARTETSLSLAWTDSTSGSGTLQETSMVVQRRTLGGNFQNWATLAANVISYIDTGKPANPMLACSTFQYRILAARDYGGSAGIIRSGSNIITAKTLGCPPGVFNITDPTSNETLVNAERAIFEWGIAEEASTYAVIINRTAGGTLGQIYASTVNAVDVCGATRCSFTPNVGLLAELTNGSYTWTVVATNSKGSTGNNNPTAGSPTPSPITFFVNDTAQPRNFDLLGPIDGMLLRDPADFGGLTWRDNRDAKTYALSVIQVSTNTRLGSIIDVSGLTWQSDADALTCNGVTRICTYTLSVGEVALLQTGSYAWTVKAVSPGGAQREARNGAGKFGVRTTDIELLRNGSFEDQLDANVKRAANWSTTGIMKGDRRVCFVTAGIAHDGLCVWKFTGSPTEKSQIYQEFPDRIGLVFGDKVVFSGFAETVGTTTGRLTLKLTITYVNPSTAPTIATIILTNGTSAGYTNLPDVLSTISGPVSSIRVAILNKVKAGKINLDSINVTLLASTRNTLQSLPGVEATTRDGAGALPLPQAPDGFRDEN